MQSFFRRAVTVTVAGTCLACLGILAVPTAVAAVNQATVQAVSQATTDAITHAVLDANAQSFEMPLSAVTAKADALPTAAIAATMTIPDAVSGSAIAAAPVRDDFGVTVYTLVQWPLPEGSSISSGFGYRSCRGCSSNHQGLDFTPGAGTPVASVADGVVVAAGWDGSYGNRVLVQHTIDGVTYTTLYAHMQSGSLAVSAGQAIGRGTILGRVGSTGASTGAHLHFEVHTSGGSAINPLPWLRQHANVPYGG